VPAFLGYSAGAVSTTPELNFAGYIALNPKIRGGFINSNDPVSLLSFKYLGGSRTSQSTAKAAIRLRESCGQFESSIYERDSPLRENDELY